MKLKDFIQITILVVIGFVLGTVLSMLAGTLGMISMLISSGISAFALAPVFIIMAHKVKKRGAAFLFWIIYGIIYSLMGFWIMLPICVISAVVSELLIGKYESESKMGFSFSVGMLIEATHIIIFVKVLGVDGILKYTSLFTEKQALDLVTFFTNKHIIISILINIVCAFVAGRFGIYVNRKFFKKNKKESKL